MSDATITTTIAHYIDIAYDPKYKDKLGLTITNTGLVETSGGSYRAHGSEYGDVYGAITSEKYTPRITKITNDGTVLAGGEQAGIAIDPENFGQYETLFNNGLIRGGEDGGLGVELRPGVLSNSGTIAGGSGSDASTGVYLVGTLYNLGLITGNDGSAGTGGLGVDLYNGVIINSGTINGGGGEAIRIVRGGTLIAQPGAAFIGGVVCNTVGNPSNVLEVQGTSAAALAGVGTSFQGFGTISFAAGAAWTIEGNAAGLAAGQTITGLDNGDAILLDSFAAATSTYIGGAGLILANGTQTETLDITGHFSTGDFTITDHGYTTRITATITPPSTISGTVTTGITLGSGGYDSPLTVTDTGDITPAAGGATGVTAAAGTIINQGSITGGRGVFLGGPPQAGGIGVTLVGATLINSGTITGGQGGGNNPGGGAGGAGVDLAGGALTNSGAITGGTGAIDGGTGGTGGVGLYLRSGTASNSGTITGGAGGGAMYGEEGFPAAAGVMQLGGQLTNTGTILGGLSDTSLLPGANGDGLIMTGGSTENRGLITGGSIVNAYQRGGTGLYLLAGTLANDGRINGGPSSYYGPLAIRVLDGTLINNADGTITGGEGAHGGGGGVEMSGAGTIENNGLITGGAGPFTAYGVLLFAGSFSNTGTVEGGLFVETYTNQPASGATNTGSVAGGAFVSAGTLNNLAGGVIAGTIGVDVSGGLAENAGRIIATTGGVGGFLTGGTLANSGSITGGAGGGNGVYLNGGVLDNSGVIVAGAASGAATVAGTGVVAFIGSTLDNTGTILGGSGGISNAGGYGVRLSSAAGANSGLIEGGFGRLGGSAVYLSGATFTNAGTLEAGQGATPGDAVSFTSRASTLIADPGAAFLGAVVGSNPGDELELGTGAPGAAGTLDMGGSFSAFGTILFDVGTPWTLAGTAAELATGQKIAAFANADTILLEDFTATSHSFIAGAGLELANGTTTETLNLLGAFSTSSFIVTDTAAGTEIQLCYLRGTRIATPVGDIPIETLEIGDTVITRFNGYRRIKWIGRQSFSRRFIANNRDQLPVRIAAGALGPNLPRRDLSVSPGHSMLIGNILVLASNLVNGLSIRQSDCPEEIHYYQLEFETHDCVLAEGAWSESFCDYAHLRRQFHNAAEFHTLYPDHITPSEHLMCAPRPTHGPQLQTVLNAILRRAACDSRKSA